jgi:signal transduction histidine kinase
VIYQGSMGQPGEMDMEPQKGDVVLIVDDDPQVVRTMAMALAGRGVASLTAHSVAEARAMLAADNRIVVVLSDINMPDGSGLELADALPPPGDHAGAVELVFMTGDGSAETVIEALRRKAYDFLRKPFRMSDLATVVGGAMRQASDRRSRGARARSVDAQVREAREIGDRLAEHLTKSLRALADTKAALNRAEEVRENLFAVIGHERRTPLIPILGFVELMIANPEVPPETRARMLESIRDEGGRLLTLIETALDILALQQPDALRVAPAVGLRGLLADSAAGFEDRAAQKGVCIDVTAPEASLPCDPDRVRRALSALLDNALKASPAGAGVEVEGRCAGHAVEIRVRDRGPGASRQVIQDVGLPFMQGDMSTTRAWPGAGLGLAFVARVAAAHGGVFSLDNAEGGGAVALLRLPNKSA